MAVLTRASGSMISRMAKALRSGRTDLGSRGNLETGSKTEEGTFCGKMARSIKVNLRDI